MQYLQAAVRDSFSVNIHSRSYLCHTLITPSTAVPATMAPIPTMATAPPQSPPRQRLKPISALEPLEEACCGRTGALGALVESLMKKAGQLGLLAVSIPEKYQGLGMGFNTGMLICEEISSLTGSVATAFGAHTGIGTLPILLYGTEQQKDYYLPKISSGEWISCYNLTEPDAGSDA